MYLSDLQNEVVSIVKVLEMFGDKVFTKADYDKATKFLGPWGNIRMVTIDDKKIYPHTLNWLYENGLVTREKSEPFKKTVTEWDYSKQDEVEKEIEVFRYEYKTDFDKLNALKSLLALYVA